MKTRERILSSFRLVEGRCYRGTRPDDWREDLPENFNCSSFVHWMALRALGWGDREKKELKVANARALWNDDFPRVALEDIEPGDVIVYQSDEEDSFGEPEYHTMVYIGDEKVVGACNQQQCVTHRQKHYETEWTILGAVRVRKMGV